MSFLPAWLNPFDVLIGLALLAGIALGFVRGLVRMALILLVLYIAVVLAMSFYTVLGGWIFYLSDRAMHRTSAELVAFALILILTTVLLNFVLSRTYKDTELPGVRQVDQLGGMVFGFLVTCTWIGLTIVALAFALNATDATSSRLRDNLLAFYHGSNLIPVFTKALPLIVAALRPWMPKGLPPDIFSRKYF